MYVLKSKEEDNYYEGDGSILNGWGRLRAFEGSSAAAEG
jgi:hypothetical protein